MNHQCVQIDDTHTRVRMYVFVILCLDVWQSHQMTRNSVDNCHIFYFQKKIPSLEEWIESISSIEITLDMLEEKLSCVFYVLFAFSHDLHMHLIEHQRQVHVSKAQARLLSLTNSLQVRI